LQTVQLGASKSDIDRVDVEIACIDAGTGYGRAWPDAAAAEVPGTVIYEVILGAFVVHPTLAHSSTSPNAHA
jgi:hypothetical protein